LTGLSYHKELKCKVWTHKQKNPVWVGRRYIP